jgi:hypothetical protein
MTGRPSLLVLVISLALPCAACGREPTETAEAPKLDEGMKTAERARDALAKRMMGRVMEAVAEGGHANAVEVCSKEAIPITRAVGAEFGVKIGRTSARVRNPENRDAPRWAEAMLEDEPKVAVQSRDQDGTLHAIFPILLAEPCLKCHGAEDELAPGVKGALARLYPDDEATGFSVGELRGWFWVEVPPS